MANIFENLKLLKKDMEDRGWVIDSFIFSYNNEDFIVLVKLFVGNEKKKEKYALVKLEFLRQSDLNSSLQVEANSNALFIDTKTLREYFKIEYNENLGDILRQFKEYFSRFIPIEVVEDKSDDQLRVIVAYLSKSDSENPNKLYCYQVRRNGYKSDGTLAQRSFYNDNKTRILRRILYTKLKNEKNISFCYSENKNDENTDEIILANWVKKQKVKY
ncbi:hypothetical protein H70357_07900 [Paenibacillus sp. FSL H7-0357]|uniref:DUF6037 family protein n=1 Tax=Paenibacillus sp. FSL H7-0357 TaxID=1536774 RepID=UPI0004F80778|nr:DUF6037 family protein [Paenibacillus sp. FSL H7-0357]AIQ16601.1 hypothetical protein H70357_07900 [Paenibacillus sp. FSL H7-0357]